MKSPVVSPFYVPKDNQVIGFRLKAKVGDIVIPSEALLDSFEGESDLAIDIDLNTSALIEHCHLTNASKLSIVLNLVCDRLAIQCQIFERNIDTQRARFTFSDVIGAIPNLVYQSGFTLEARVIAIKPVPDDDNDPLICSFSGAILARDAVSAIRQDQANVLPIEFVSFNDNRMWQVEFDFEADGNGIYDLDIPLAAAIRLALDSQYFSHCFDAGAKPATTSLAISILSSALCTEVLLYCGERPELVEQLQAAFHQIKEKSRPAWINDTSSLGYHLLMWFTKATNGRPFSSVSSDFRDSVIDSIAQLRTQFASPAYGGN